MHIITRRALNEFAEKYPEAKAPLDAWYQIVRHAEFHNLVEVKGVFPATDYVQGVCVFDIGGNKFRLVAKVEYRWQKVFIKAVMTHNEYERGAWKPKPRKK